MVRKLRINEGESYPSSDELARKGFVSLVRLYPYGYSVLNDGYFVCRIAAENDDDAIRQFYEFLKTDWNGAWRDGTLPKYFGESKKRPMKKRVTEANKGYSAAVYDALDDNYVSEWDGKVDPAFIADNVELFIYNTKRYYDEIFNTRRKATSVAYEGLLAVFQSIANDYDLNVRVTSEMAKQWLKRHGIDYIEMLKPVVDFIEQEREERSRGN